MEIHLPLLPFLICGPLFVALYLGALPWVVRHTDLVSRARAHVRRFAPLYLVVGPSAMTYFALCGTLSASLGVAWILLLTDGSREQILQSGIYRMFRAVEWACSLAGSYGFAWLLRWLDVPRFWFVILFVSLAVCAVYRTARLDPGPEYSGGPAILLSPELLDAVPVAAGMALFLWHSSRLRGP